MEDSILHKSESKWKWITVLIPDNGKSNIITNYTANVSAGRIVQRMSPIHQSLFFLSYN